MIASLRFLKCYSLNNISLNHKYEYTTFYNITDSTCAAYDGQAFLHETKGQPQSSALTDGLPLLHAATSRCYWGIRVIESGKMP